MACFTTGEQVLLTSDDKAADNNNLMNELDTGSSLKPNTKAGLYSRNKLKQLSKDN